MTSDGDPAFWHWALQLQLQNSLVVFRFHDAMHTVKASGARSSKATPKHLWTSTMFDRRDQCSFLWRPHFIFFKQYNNVLYQKALLWSHLSTWRSPRRILASSGNVLANSSLAFLCLCQQWGPPGSPTIASHFIQMAMDSASWHCCTLCLQVSLNLFGSWSRFFIHHSNNPSLQSFIIFSLPSTSREVSYSAYGL